MLMVRDRRNEKRKRDASFRSAAAMARAERAQDRSHNFHPRAIRKQHPALVRAIGASMEAVVHDPMGFYAEMFDGFSYDAFAGSVERVPASSYRESGLHAALRAPGPRTVLFTGGGIVPPPVFEIPDLRLIHVHTGFLPHVRGADVLLWSLMVRGRPGVSAFFMAPGIDEGDVLAAKELPPLAVQMPPGTRHDDDTLYRALFSFVDPLIRAELLVADVLSGVTDPAAIPATPQRVDEGVTYHFMHPVVRQRALAVLYRQPRIGAEPTPVGAGPSPARYRKYYEKASALAPLRFALDARLARTSLRKLGLRNRQTDYARIAGDPELLALHGAMNRELAEQTERWGSYDYGEGYYYQSSDRLKVTGLRDTTGRVEAFGLRDLVHGRRVLEIGCNTGFLTLDIAGSAGEILAFELNPYLIAIAKLAAAHTGAKNVDFRVAAFEDLDEHDPFDDVLSFANHHTYDGNTRQSLEEYFERCHALTRPGGRLIFESHPPELEGSRFGHTLEIIERHFDVERTEVHAYGTFLDANRRFIVARRR
jgi:SAM-dependent methyltransferase